MPRRLFATLAALTLLALSGCNSDDSGSAQPSQTPGETAGTETAGTETAGTAPQPAPELPEWEERAPIDTPRDDFATAVVGDEIWTFGGMTGARGTRLRTSEVYDTTEDSWHYGPEVPAGLASFEGVAVDDKVYLFGGLDEDAEPSAFAAMLDTTTGEWTRLPPLPHPRYAHDVDIVDGKIYVIGGEAHGDYVAAVDVFDPTTRSWSQAGTMPHPRASVDIVPLDGKMYVLGGWDVSRPTDLMQVFDPSSGTWSETEPLPQPMSRGGAAAVNGKIWVSLHEFSAVYDPEQRSWSEANPMTVARHGLGYVAVDDRIYGIGGCTESPLRDVSFVDVLDLQSRESQ